MTIIFNTSAYADYPIEAISPDSLCILKTASGKIRLKNQVLCLERLFRCLECFLEVTGQQLEVHAFKDGTFSTISKSFIGAFNSIRLVHSTLEWKYTMTLAWLSLIQQLKADYPSIDIPTVIVKPTSVDPIVQSWADEFNVKTLDAEKVWLWKGWSSSNRNGQVILLPLYPVYRRLGRKFTEQLFEVVDHYYRARQSTRVPCFRPLTRFIDRYPVAILPADFQRSEFISRFWRDFFVYFVTTSYAGGKGKGITYIINEWRNQFLPFVNEHLIPSGLFAEPWGELPSPPPKCVKGGLTKIKSTPHGHKVKTNLLTHVPLDISDEDTFHLLFRQIEEDLQIILRWAEWACNDIWIRYQRRINLAPQGTPKKILDVGTYTADQRWLTDRNNPDCMKNTFATFACHGFQTRKDAALNLLFPCPISITAGDLALPITDALLPHCFILVASHPAITTAFLEKLEVFDKNGKQTGFVATDSGYHLVGHKDRRGSNLAQQIIPLNLRTTEIVQQILALTAPLRDYLRVRGDDQWRYMLLTCKQGFGSPARVRNLAGCTSLPERKASLVEGLANTSELSIEDRKNFIERTSLQTVRASAGVQIYLKTRSVEKMAKALGHAKHKPELLEHYLPKPILDFFEERWIRIFQTGIIVEALNDSPHLLHATDFSHMNELHNFLSNHALKLIPHHTSNSSKDAVSTEDLAKNEVVFGVNTEILTALISLQLTVKSAKINVDARAKYWAGVSERLVSYIESTLVDRADLQSFVKIARDRAHAFDLPGVVHAT